MVIESTHTQITLNSIIPYAVDFTALSVTGLMASNDRIFHKKLIGKDLKETSSSSLINLLS
jgi:hypothetical protein